MHFFLFFRFLYIFFLWGVYTKRLNLILFFSITQLVRCPCLERDFSLGYHVHVPCWVTPQIFIHTVTVVSGSPTQQQTSLTSAAWDSLHLQFSLVFSLVTIEPVQHGDAQMSHPLRQVSDVPELLCGVVDWLD